MTDQMTAGRRLTFENLDEQSGQDLARLTAIVRIADEQLHHDGGGTRHWVRDYFAPALEADGLAIVELTPDAGRADGTSET